MPPQRKCRCSKPQCLGKQPASVQQGTAAHTDYLVEGGTEVELPEAIIKYCCLKCRFAGRHICGKLCYSVVYKDGAFRTVALANERRKAMKALQMQTELAQNK